MKTKNRTILCLECNGTGIKPGITKEVIEKCPIPSMCECDQCEGYGYLKTLIIKDES